MSSSGSHNTRTVAIAAALAVLTVGCAMRADNPSERIAEALSQIVACDQKNRATDAGRLLSQRFLISQDDPQRLEKMAIDHYATAEEKDAIVAFSAADQTCRTQAMEAMAKIDPELIAWLAGVFAWIDERNVMVLKDEITVGQANRESQQRFAADMYDFQQIVQRIQERADAERQERAWRWMMATQNLQNAFSSMSTRGTYGGAYDRGPFTRTYTINGRMVTCSTIGTHTTCF